MSGAQGMGASVARKEDRRFLLGKGRYTDDIVLPEQTWGVFVRSPYAHAAIRSVDAAAALASPGVLAVLTGDDVATDGLGGIPCGWQITNKDGSVMVEPPHPALAQGKVRHAGDPVALVIAETRAQARDAAQLVAVDYDPQPVVAHLNAAVAEGAPLVWDEAPGNVCFDWHIGDSAATEAEFAGAAHVTAIDLVNNRVVPNAIEPRAANGHYDMVEDRYTLYTTSQNPHLTRLLLGAFTLKVPEHKLRVVAPDVGGGFGSKIFHYAEELLVLWASKRVGRPVKWTSSRSEAFLSDAHGRDHVTHAELALDADGRFRGLRVRTLANMGAYLSTFSTAIPTYLHGTLLSGPYVIPAIYGEVKAIFTHTVPVDAVRGAGRPEATYLLERLVDKAARELGIDRVEIRRKNLIQPDQFPYQTPVAVQYDIGDYEATLDLALQAIDYPGLARRKEASKARGKLRGFGISTYIEACGIAPSALVGALGARAGLYEAASVRVHPTGSVSVFTGTHSHGQGHETTFAQLVNEKLGIPIENIEVVHGDTDRIPFGMGTYGSRSAAVGGSAIVKAIDKIVEKGKKIAAHLLEASVADVEFSDGKYRVVGHRPREGLRRGGVRRLRAAQLSHRHGGAGAGGFRFLRSQELHFPRRLPHRRGRDRSRDGRRGGGGRGHRGRRRRDHQSDDRRRPGPWRSGARDRAGPAGRVRLRRRRAAPVRIVHELHHAARGGPAFLQGGQPRDRVHAQPGRHQGRG